ncbi:unnamed protein product [Pleuronectes platessa]|uniref:Uncharacterized protein n=1 Tax=Pleuronectes platessa TaxID=8262 RepID=A0A9N7VBF4_PLEPL|nr:unnamed protein product [Pleuronectes platessa]
MSVTQLQSVTLVVVVFITVSAQPANSTRVIRFCTSSQSCFDHQNHSHQCVSLCSSSSSSSSPHRAHTITLVTDTLSHSHDAAAVHAAGCTLCPSRLARAAARVSLALAAFSIAVAGDVLTSATIRHAHWRAAQPEQLARYAA